MDTRIGWDLTLAALLLSFALSLVVSWVYVATYQGLSYMRSFAMTLGIAGVLSCLVMLAIGDDVARGLGLVGALTVIRFRTTLKDTRDLMFAFAALAIGVACGVLAFSVAILGTAIFCGGMVYLSFSAFGSRRQWNAVLRLQVPTEPGTQRALAQVLGRHTPSFVLINLRDLGGGNQEHAYHLKLRGPEDKGQLLQALSAVPGVGAATLLMQDTSVEP
jgi:hypothetical protein